VRIVPIIQDRLKTLADAAARIPFFFSNEFEYDAGELVQRKMDEAGTLRALDASLPVIQSVEPFDAAGLEEKLRPLADSLGIKVGQLLGTLRVATSGLKVSPPLFESMEVLGRERVVQDIDRAIEKLKASNA
jgi:glutamyl/glutaminyl-tRNA synthetase